MLTKSRTKMMIALIATPIGIAIILAAFLGLSRFIASFQEGADPASIFRGHDLTLPDDDQAVWLSTAPQRGVSPARSQQEELIAAYWLAWQTLSHAYETGLTDDLSTYWANPILETVTASVVPGQQFETNNHELSLLFFSDDRSVAQIEDRFIVTVNGSETRAIATLTLTLDTGRWRIRLMTLDYLSDN